MDLEAEERALGNWPRRLLHVPTLTSYEWQPGNLYNNIGSPLYNAITYTWGRYRLADTERPDIRAVPISIHGGDWKIPRVHDDHFSRQDFQNAIQTAGTYVSPEDESASVEFLWLDVACIDQRGTEPRSAAEIGRQAVIFNGARSVFVWLTSVDISRLEHTINGMSHNEGLENPEPPQLQHMVNLMSDRWFSSLWTLQEAYLRGNDAILMSRDGSLVLSPNGIKPSSFRPLDLGWLCGVGTSWFHESVRIISDGIDANTQIYQDFIDELMKRGLYHIQLRNELAMYDAVRNRVTSYPEDRIYGIQQIFGLRVGKSAISADTGKYFTLTEVEDQFGMQMLQHFPVLSQFHGFTKHVPAAKRWRFRDEALMVAGSPSAEVQGTREKGGKDQLSSFWVDHTHPNGKAVYWKGLMSSLRALKHSMDRLLMEDTFLFSTGTRPECLAAGTTGGMLRVVLDHVDEISEINGFKTASMIEVYERLEQKFPNEELKVLVIGPSWSGNAGQMFAILLVKTGGEDWARLGICVWSVPLWTKLEEEKLAFLHGRGEIWEVKQGIFGYFG